MRYVYLGDKLTDPRWVGQPCDPVLRSNPFGSLAVAQGAGLSGAERGKLRMTVIRGRRPRNQLVRFADGSLVVVLGRRLRVAFEETGEVVSDPIRPFDKLRMAQGELRESNP